MYKRSLLFILVVLYLFAGSLCAYGFSTADIEAIYAGEADANVRNMGVMMLKKELGLDAGSDARTIGTFSRSNNDFITMTSLVNVNRQSVADLTDQSFVLRLGKAGSYDAMYYAERGQDLELLLYHINNVKAMTSGMSDREKSVFINNYICDSFSFRRHTGSSSSAVEGFKSGITNCRGYTASFYIIGMNCGLNVKAECAHNSTGSHTYNIVNISGEDYVVDTSANDLYGTDDYLLIPYAAYMAGTNSVKVRDSLADLDSGIVQKQVTIDDLFKAKEI